MRRAEIERLLPDIFQRTLGAGTPLTAVLQVMENQHQPSEDVLVKLDSYFDPYRTPEKFVAMLARWVDLDWLVSATPDQTGMTGPGEFASGWGHLRELIAAAVYLSRWRGTARGLLGFLERATGITGFQLDEHVVQDGRPRPFHIRITAPAEAAQYRALIVRSIQARKPVYATYELQFAQPHG